MNIQAITPLRTGYISFGSRDNKKQVKNDVLNTEYKPAVYKDRNTLNGRLFRSPEDFYSQPFNQNGMPVTMKKYLNRNFEKRQHIPPMQVMQIVFNKLNKAASLDDVKKLYPSEPLFSNLSSKPKVKTAVIADIEYVKKDNPSLPLFKDGHDDLGMYLLKKIYLEGKMLSEIDKDFQKDINSEYKGIEHIKDETIYSYGIRRPKSGFWQSLVHNRDNFPYVYIPRNINGQSENKKSETKIVEKTQVQLKPRRKLSDEQKRKMSEYMLDLWKEISPEERENRRKRVKLGQENSFLFKYTQPIMTLAAAQVNLSGRLSDYLSGARVPENLEKIVSEVQEDGIFIDFDTPNGKQKAIMKAFWKDNDGVKGEFASAIKETLDEFQQAYGADGENDEFRMLVQIADDIRKENAERTAYRRQRKADVEAAFKDYTDPFDKAPDAENNGQINKQLKKFEDENALLDEILNEQNAQSYTIKTEDGDYKIVANFKEEFRKSAENTLRHYPKSYVATYLNFLDKTSLLSDEFMVSSLLEANGQPDLADKVMDKETREKITGLINNEFSLRNENAQRAATQVVTDFLAACRFPGERAKVYFADPYELSRALNAKVLENGEFYTPQNIKVMNESYHYYKRPLTSGEINKISHNLIAYIRNLDPSTLVMKNGEKAVLLETMSENIKHSEKYKEILLRTMRNDKFLENYGGSLRMLLSQSRSREERNAKAEKVLYNLLDFDGRLTFYLATSNAQTVENIIKKKSPSLYLRLQKQANFNL